MAFEIEHEMKLGAAPTPDEVTIETRSLRVFSDEEDEYEWIVRSTPAIAIQIFIEDWREPELMRSPATNLTELGECNQSVSRSVRIAGGFLAVDSECSAPDVQSISPADDASEPITDSASTTIGDEDLFADWTGPDLVPANPANFEPVSRGVGIAADSPPVASARSETPDHSVPPAMAGGSPAVESVVDDAFIDWSAPDLVASPQGDFEDVELKAHADLVQSSSSITIDESALAEWTGPELLPPAPVGAGNNLDDIEANELEEPPASELSLAGESASSEWTDPELTPALPVESKEIEADEYEEITEPGSSRLNDEAEVDRCIAPDTVAAVQTRTLVVQSRPSVVQSLKDPPEIWDQVPEQPADFHPAVTFLARVTADNRKLLLVTLAVMVFCGISTFAVLKLRQLDRDIEFVTQLQSEHRMEPPPPAVGEKAASTEQTVAEANPEADAKADAGSKATSSEPANDKSSPTSANSSSAITANQKLAKPDAPAETAKNSDEPAKNSVESSRNSDHPTDRSVVAITTKRRKAPQPDARRIARNASTTPRSVPVNSNASTTPKRVPTTGRTSESARKPEPAPIINVGDGETRPRLVKPRSPTTKDGR